MGTFFRIVGLILGDVPTNPQRLMGRKPNSLASLRENRSQKQNINLTINLLQMNCFRQLFSFA